MKKVVFCLSYLNIPWTESIILSHENFMVLTSESTIYKYFTRKYGKKNIFLFEEFNLNLAKSLSSWFIIRRRNLCLINSVSDAEVYFFCASFGHTALWMIRKMSVSNDIYYKQEVQLEKNLEGSFDVRTVLHRLVVLFMLGVNMSIHYTKAGARLIPSKRFIKQNNVRDVRIDLVDGRSSLDSDENIDVLYLSGDVIPKVGIVNSDEFIRLNSELIDLLSNYNSFIKPHPRLSSLTPAEERLRRIDALIPATMLFKGRPVVIGYGSASLFEASNNGLLAISLLKYYHFIEEEVRDSGIAYLKANCLQGCQIEYPEKLEELSKLLYSFFNCHRNYDV
ncbi:hypothetical protein N9C15_00925 [Schleiferiaceae bacterium]|nr:hypothetical protein [Schleiferiaceae bacterium]